MGFIAIVVVTNALVSLVTIRNISNVLVDEVQTRVRLNLNAARSIYDGSTRQIGEFLRAASLDGVIARAVEGGTGPDVAAMLERIRHEGDMDLLGLVGPDGRLITHARAGGSAGEDLNSSALVQRGLRTKSMVHGTVIVPHQRLVHWGVDLARRATVVVQETPSARRESTRVLMDGMAIGAVTPIVGEGGKLLGLLYGAKLISSRYDIVDDIKARLFQNERYQGKDIGTATIFQDDLRISTNVSTREGQRAVGTRMSAEVFAHVIQQGQIWAQRAFVVNDWYISAYGPIQDPNGKIIGSLYVGLLEAPFTQPRTRIATLFLFIMGVTTLISLALIFLVTKAILRPISSVIEMSRKLENGDLAARVNIKAPGEMGLLCMSINQMADAVCEREAQLKIATNSQLRQSEKLASIGRLAAGIAHEINNPLTGVLTFSHLLRKKSTDEQDRQDLDLIVRETTRVREIVRGLLDFARGTPSTKEPMEINEVIRQTLRLVGSHSEFKGVNIQDDLAEGLPAINGDRNQLQQVILNICMNGCEAMPKGGSLLVATSLAGDEVVIAITDTGCGIPQGELERIFDPFYTTKPAGKGTGLGLSVSYGIVQQHEGRIEVESRVGDGTTFRVFLPVVKGVIPEARRQTNAG
jgi:two-component system, NtrC family, sensor kinase